MQIREAGAADRTAIRAVHLAAFPPEEAEEVAGLATALLSAQTTPAVLSLVAEVAGAIEAHAAFSPVWRADDGQLLGYNLAPVGVRPERQRAGLGSQLIQWGLQRLRQRRAERVFVYGDPAYYGRFGFDTDTAARFQPPCPLTYPSGWQVLQLSDLPAGDEIMQLRMVEALSDPALW